MTLPCLLIIAGSDPSCGAGLQADIRVTTAHGCYPTAVTTALTVQNTTGVSEVHTLAPDIVAAQAGFVMTDICPAAIKIGMLGNAKVAEAVLSAVEKAKHNLGCRNIVVDTILKSTSGKPLIDDWNSSAFCSLLRAARVITPNLPEALALTGTKTNTPPEELATLLSLKFGGVSVYLKGGHAEGDTVTDLFFNAEEQHLTAMQQPRIDTPNTHGTGCCLSTSLAALLAKGHSLDRAASQANAFMHRALTNGRLYNIGHGHGPSFIC